MTDRPRSPKADALLALVAIETVATEISSPGVYVTNDPDLRKALERTAKAVKAAMRVVVDEAMDARAAAAETPTVVIDARGQTDPAEARAAVIEALAKMSRSKPGG